MLRTVTFVSTLLFSFHTYSHDLDSYSSSTISNKEFKECISVLMPHHNFGHIKSGKGVSDRYKLEIPKGWTVVSYIGSIEGAAILLCK